MQSFKEFVQEAHVYDGIHTEIKPDRIDFHHNGELIHSHKGDYSNPTKQHKNTARAIASRISTSMKGGMGVNGKTAPYKLNKGVI
jgi:hypothetical protein